MTDDTVQLERLRHEVLRRLAASQLAGADVSVTADVLAGGYIAHIRHTFWSRDVKRVTVEWPATWWQHFKRDVLRRRRVRMARRTIETRAVYPTIRFGDHDHEGYGAITYDHCE